MCVLVSVIVVVLVCVEVSVVDEVLEVVEVPVVVVVAVLVPVVVVVDVFVVSVVETVVVVSDVVVLVDVDVVVVVTVVSVTLVAVLVVSVIDVVVCVVVFGVNGQLLLKDRLSTALATTSSFVRTIARSWRVMSLNLRTQNLYVNEESALLKPPGWLYSREYSIGSAPTWASKDLDNILLEASPRPLR